jgi:hypothetical protein
LFTVDHLLLADLIFVLQSFDDKALHVVKGVLEFLKYCACEITVSCGVVSKIEGIQNNKV